MAEPPEETPPVTRQISRQRLWQNIGEEPVELRHASSRLVVDAAGERIPFGALYEQQKTIVVFVRVRDAPVRRPQLPLQNRNPGAVAGEGRENVWDRCLEVLQEAVSS